MSKKINLYVVGTPGAITKCRSLSTAASDVWIRTGNDINYNNGNVGIGVSTPTAAFDIAGEVNIVGGVKATNLINAMGGIAIGPVGADASTTCASPIKVGTTRYNATSDKMEYCNKLGKWVSFGTQAAAATNCTKVVTSYFNATNSDSTPTTITYKMVGGGGGASGYNGGGGSSAISASGSTIVVANGGAGGTGTYYDANPVCGNGNPYGPPYASSTGGGGGSTTGGVAGTGGHNTCSYSYGGTDGGYNIGGSGAYFEAYGPGITPGGNGANGGVCSISGNKWSSGGGGYGSGGGGSPGCSSCLNMNGGSNGGDGQGFVRGSAGNPAGFGGLGANNWATATTLPPEAGAGGPGGINNCSCGNTCSTGGNAGLVILTYSSETCWM